MDYIGQKHSEWTYQIIIILFSLIAFVVGYVKSSFAICMQIWAVGAALAMIVCVPNFPFWNRNKLPWQTPAVVEEPATVSEEKSDSE